MKSNQPQIRQLNRELDKILKSMSETELNYLHQYIDKYIWEKRFKAFVASVDELDKAVLNLCKTAEQQPPAKTTT